MIMIFSKLRIRTPLFFLLLIAGFAFLSCSGLIGYGVLSWSLPEQKLSAGDVVPVFIQSNIGQVYVVGTGKGYKTRIEVPLWQLTLYKSKAQATKAAKEFYEYRYTYALVKLDGLPIRALPENTARQVYRLKQGQKIKVIRKGEGTPVFTGNSPLEGDWLEVMTDDGSKGWSFSYNLNLFDERDEGAGLEVAVEEGPDTVLESILSRSWYPDLYRTMILDNRIDIDRINPAWGFFPGKDTGVARIDTSEGILSFPYDAIVRTEDGLYQFQGSNLTMQARRRDSLAVQYTDSNGMPQVHYFASLDITGEQLIEAERERRSDVLSSIRSAGPLFVSGNYGVLQFLEGGRFLWSGYQILSPSVIPSGSGAGGIVEPRCFLSDALLPLFDGVLSFSFDSGIAWLHFLYNVTPQGLKLELVNERNITDSIVQSRNLNPTVIFFTPDNAPKDGQ